MEYLGMTLCWPEGKSTERKVRQHIIGTAVTRKTRCVRQKWSCFNSAHNGLNPLLLIVMASGLFRSGVVNTGPRQVIKISEARRRKKNNWVGSTVNWKSICTSYKEQQLPSFSPALPHRNIGQPLSGPWSFQEKPDIWFLMWNCLVFKCWELKNTLCKTT